MQPAQSLCLFAGAASVNSFGFRPVSPLVDFQTVRSSGAVTFNLSMGIKEDSLCVTS